VVICLERGADLHMAQLMLLPLTVSCSSKIQIGFTFLVPAHLGSPGKTATKRVCVLLTTGRVFNSSEPAEFLLCTGLPSIPSSRRQRRQTELLHAVLCTNVSNSIFSVFPFLLISFQQA